VLPFNPVPTGTADNRRAVLGVIPARYGASRFPGKPLAMLWGKPMLQHVWERARAARGLDELVVATDDERIASAARGWGASVEMTSPSCTSGTDRVAEVAHRRPQAQVILNLQGDEPELETGAVTRLVEAMRADESIVMGTVAHHEPGRAATFAAASIARDAGVPIVVDLDYRADQWDSAATFALQLQTLLDSVSAKIDTATLADLYKQVAVDKKDIKDVASAWLKANGFVS